VDIKKEVIKMKRGYVEYLNGEIREFKAKDLDEARKIGTKLYKEQPFEKFSYDFVSYHLPCMPS
jgi:hypothetical protein